MSKNFIQHGRTCTFVAPYAVASGGGFLVGSIFAVAQTDAASGAKVEGDVEGVFSLPKAAGASTAITAGAKVYWDNAAKAITKTASGNTLIGAALEDAADGATACVVRLNGVAA